MTTTFPIEFGEEKNSMKYSSTLWSEQYLN